jgi:choline kinase
MQIILMAAGRGSRLGSLTEALPKALIDVDGEPLIAHALHFARQAGASRRIVVGGYFYEDVARAVRAVDAAAVLLENTNLLAGNILSLVVGLTQLEPGGFLLMNTDHIYPELVARLVSGVAQTANEVTAFCDFDRSLGADDMKVQLRDGRVVAMSKTLVTWDAGYVGMTYVPESARAAYLSAVTETRRTLGDNTPVERVLVSLAQAGMGPTIADISGHGWFEVDEPHEREQAEAALRRRRSSTAD